ncbi:MAG TPA: phenylalanine--tRNA ligase subunit beta [Acidimicrobiales bacterium]|nr:phenylalanine--tRNA ligase subunit beta [Acidimicrobiales bacterium]
MRAPLSWLKDFTPIDCDPADAAAVQQLRGVLDSLGLVVEATERVGGGLEGVVLARVLEVHAIEGADRIRQVFVDAGGDERVEIVCGARNFAVGDLVPLATVGAELPNGMVIARRKMRGVTSDGMLCSGSELLVDDGVDGLLIVASTGGPEGPLPEGLALGQPIAGVLGIEADVVFDIEVEPNRPDCLSIAGIARDLAAALGLPFALPEPQLSESGPGAASLASATTAAPELCPRLVARVLTGVRPVASPAALARRLELAGMRPINSVVDASNYVMLELGQPTHPYDLDRLGGGGIAVRPARPGERLETLDGATHTLGVGPDGSAVEELVITDASDAVVGLAGVMGGASSEITEGTSRVLLEVADFDALVVGTSAQRHQLRTEASVRFWRGTDPAGLERAAARFCEFVTAAQVAAGLDPPAVAPGPLSDGPGRPAPAPIALRPARLNALLGTALGVEAITLLLERIGFRVADAGGVLEVTPPTFRPDARREVDLIEEVARHHGYAAVARTERRSPKVGRLTDQQRARRELRRALQGLGASEAWTSSLLDPALLGHLGIGGGALRVRNPVVSGEDTLRTHLLPGLLAALARNEARRSFALRLFEIGKVFSRSGEEPSEREHLALLLAGPGEGAAGAVAAWRALVDWARIDPAAHSGQPLEGTPPPLAAGLHPTRSGLVVAADGPLAALGEVDPEVAARFGLSPRPVGALVIDLEAFLALARRDGHARPVSRYPSADIDLAFALPASVPASALRKALAAAAAERLESIELVDVYRGPGLPAESRSLAFRLRLSALDHTLSEEEIGEIRGRCIAAAEQQLSATLRG